MNFWNRNINKPTTPTIDSEGKPYSYNSLVETQNEAIGIIKRELAKKYAPETPEDVEKLKVVAPYLEDITIATLYAEFSEDMYCAGWMSGPMVKGFCTLVRSNWYTSFYNS